MQGALLLKLNNSFFGKFTSRFRVACIFCFLVLLSCLCMLCAYFFMDKVWAMFLARIPFVLGGGALARAPLGPDITVHSVLVSRPSLQVLTYFF